MNSYIAMFRMKLIAGMQYRAAAWAGVATQFFWGFMLLMIYRAFYRSSGTVPPMSWIQLVAYIWLNQAFLAIIMLWSVDSDLISGITDGQVAYELCRPYDMYCFWFARLVAARLKRRVTVLADFSCILPTSGTIPNDTPCEYGVTRSVFVVDVPIFATCHSDFDVCVYSNFYHNVILRFSTRNRNRCRVPCRADNPNTSNAGLATESIEFLTVPLHIRFAV